jgi:hypothetical protein
VLLHDPNPRAVRPLLAIWPDRPPPGERLPKPESVWRCNDELLELESVQEHVEVHEAWVDHAGDPVALTVDDPRTAFSGVAGDEPLELGGSLAASTGGRVAGLAVLAAVLVLVD